MSTRPPRLRRTSLALSALLLALALGGCAGGDESDSEGAASEAGDAPAADMGAAERERSAASREDGADAATTDALLIESAVISTGVVSLRGDDVAQARFDVQKVVDAHGGEITQEETDTDTLGMVSRSRLVIRVPVAEFAEAMDDLEDVAELESSSFGSEDVTSQVIDTEVRVRAQERSLERVEVLLARARSIRDIIAIESQLTRRQADLDSLKQQQAWLADQTSMSTITVHLEMTSKDQADEDDSGFLAGLAAGWHGLKAFSNGAATVLGAAITFALPLLLVAVPARYVVRRLRRPRITPTPGNGPAQA